MRARLLVDAAALACASVKTPLAVVLLPSCAAVDDAGGAAMAGASGALVTGGVRGAIAAGAGVVEEAGAAVDARGGGAAIGAPAMCPTPGCVEGGTGSPRSCISWRSRAAASG